MKTNIKYKIGLAFLLLLLITIRCYSYFLYGPFGFGYDLGIYMREFKMITEFGDLFSTQLSFLPSLGAFLFNFFQIDLGVYVYYLYLFAAVFLGVLVFEFTSRQFDKNTAVVAFLIFMISYVQVYAVQFYLFKAIFGASLMILGFYLYYLKSRWFYLVLILLALTQLPQFLILALASIFSSLFDLKKYREFVLQFWLILFVLIAILGLFFKAQIITAANVVIEAIQNTNTYDKHQSGYFITLAEYIKYNYWLIIFGLFGIYFKVKDNCREWLVYLSGILLLLFIIVFSIFFEERYIFELDLILIPFAAFGIMSFLSFIKNRFLNTVTRIIFCFFAILLFVYYIITTAPALNTAEVAALKYLDSANSASNVLVPNTFYSPWVYGFTSKNVLAPGMFDSVFTYDEWKLFTESNNEFKFKNLTEIRQKYGPIYIFLGARDDKQLLKDLNLKQVYSISGVTIYLF